MRVRRDAATAAAAAAAAVLQRGCKHGAGREEHVCSSRIRPLMQHLKQGSIFLPWDQLMETITHTLLYWILGPGGPRSPAAFIKTTNPDTCFNNF